MSPLQRSSDVTDVKRKSRCLLQRQTDTMRIIRSGVYDRGEEMRDPLDARTRAVTMKERDEKQEEKRRLKKNRRAVLTLRQDWEERQTTLRGKDKRKAERMRGKGERGKRSRAPG